MGGTFNFGIVVVVALTPGGGAVYTVNVLLRAVANRVRYGLLASTVVLVDDSVVSDEALEPPEHAPRSSVTDSATRPRARAVWRRVRVGESGDFGLIDE